MADNLDPTISMLLTRFPEHFKMSTCSPAQPSNSPAQVSAARFETSNAEPSQLNSPIDTTARKTSVDISNSETDNVGESEWTIPCEPAMSATSDRYKEKRSGTSDSTPMPGFKDVLSDQDSDTEATTLSSPKEDKAESSLSIWMKLAEKHAESLDRENKQSVSELSPELPTSSDESRAKRSISPPLEYTLIQRASCLSYKKPNPSPLRNEIYASSAFEDQEASQLDKMEKMTDSILPEFPRGGERDLFLVQTGLESSSATRQREVIMENTRALIARVDEFIRIAHIDKPAIAHLLTGSKAHKEGATEEKSAGPTRLLQDLPNKGSLLPPVISLKGASGFDEDSLSILGSSSGANQPPELRLRESGAGLSADEWAKLPNEFLYLHEDTLVEFWDLAYDPVVRETVLKYKGVLALAGEADGVVDLSNKLLVALAEIQEAEAQEGAKHVVNTSNTKTGNCKLSISAVEEEPAGLSDKDTLLAALLELENSLADPDYNNFLAREKYASSKGVKLDSETLTQLLIDFYKYLQDLHHSSKMNAIEDDQLVEDLAIGNGNGKRKRKKKGKSKGKSKGKKSKSLMDDEATGEGKAKEGDMLEEGLPIDEGKGKDDDWTLEAAANGKGKDKESSVLTNNQAIGTVRSKENDSPLENEALGEGKEGDGPIPDTYVQALVHIHTAMEFLIRTQKASSEHVDMVCELLVECGAFKPMTRWIKELSWNR